MPFWNWDYTERVESHLVELAEKLWKDTEYADITIKCEGEEFQAHRVILAPQSEYFSRLFRKNWSETATGVMEIADIPAKRFRRVLEFLYFGDYCLPDDKSIPDSAEYFSDERHAEVFDHPLLLHANMLILADRFAVPGLAKLCAAKYADQLAGGYGKLSDLEASIPVIYSLPASSPARKEVGRHVVGYVRVKMPDLDREAHASLLRLALEYPDFLHDVWMSLMTERTFAYCLACRTFGTAVVEKSRCAKCEDDG